MKKFNRLLMLTLSVAMSLSTLSACSNKDNDKIVSEGESSNVSSDVSSAPVEEKHVVNPLTGEANYDEALLKQRPVAVMINNIGPALPQSGIGDAGIVYELSVEGAVTRLMAVFSDYKTLPNVGSIRSARHDYVELVKPLNALYLHFGGSDAGKAAIKENNIDSIDGTAYSNIAFYMDEVRAQTRSSDHCWFSNADLLQAGINKKGFDMTSEKVTTLFNFAKPDEDVMTANTVAKSATTVSAQVTAGSKAGFTYDAASKQYSKTQNDNPHIDDNKKTALQFTNVFLMYTKVGFLSDNYHKEIDMSKGSGYYISNGKAIEVTFKKDSINDIIKVYDTQGSEISVNAGKSYFAVCDDNLTGKLVIS